MKKFLKLSLAFLMVFGVIEINHTYSTPLQVEAATKTYTIQFNKNGGTGTMKNMTMTYGKAKKLKANSYKRVGYTFKGWNTKANGSGKSYNNQASVKNLTSKNKGKVTLYAQWKAHTYTIQFNKNGGTGTMKNMTITYGKAKNLIANTYSYNGLVFLGWNTKADGTGTNYKNKASIKNSTSKNKYKVTLYAQWGLTPSQVQYVQDKLIALTNTQRKTKCKVNNNLQKSSLTRANEIISYFSHSRKNKKPWSDTIIATGIKKNGNFFGENLSVLKAPISPISINRSAIRNSKEYSNLMLNRIVYSIHKTWLQSPSHKDVIKDEKFNYIGLSITSRYYNGQYKIYCAEHFAKKV